MARPYGKKPRKMSNRTANRGSDSASKYKLRGKDDSWLSMREVQQGLIDIARDLGKHQDHRAKWATFFILMVDDDGKEILINPKGEKTLYPYKSAADEFGALIDKFGD
jgi:hypothetical protein